MVHPPWGQSDPVALAPPYYSGYFQPERVGGHPPWGQSDPVALPPPYYPGYLQPERVHINESASNRWVELMDCAFGEAALPGPSAVAAIRRGAHPPWGQSDPVALAPPYYSGYTRPERVYIDESPGNHGVELMDRAFAEATLPEDAHSFLRSFFLVLVPMAAFIGNRS